MRADIIGTARRSHQADGKSAPALLWHGLATTCLCLGLLASAGCRSVGPGTVKRDRLHYATAVADSLRQTLAGSAKPLRDPTRLRPGTGRGKASRRTR